MILNKKSRSAGGQAAEARQGLRSLGMDLVEYECGSADELSPSICRHRHDVDCVVVGGGDGTLNAALAGLMETGLPLGVLPLGTANDFARSAGIPDTLPAALQVIGQGQTRAVDVGDVNGHPFLNVASVGLAADLAKNLTRERKQRFGRLGYALTAAHMLTSASPFHATLIIGSERIMVKTLQIAVGNGRFYGGGNVVAIDATIDDGHLDLYSLEFSQIWRMALMVRSFPAGSHGAMREVRTARGASFEIVTRKRRPVNADGEILTHTPARFTQKPLALTVFVPADGTSAGLVTQPA